MTILKPVGSYELKAYTKQKVESKRSGTRDGLKVGKGPETVKSDTVSLSGISRDIQIAREAVRSAPEVRTEKVESLKQAIGEGRYEVDAEKIADKMVRSVWGEIL